jgi:hypothetical protein
MNNCIKLQLDNFYRVYRHIELAVHYGDSHINGKWDAPPGVYTMTE